MLSILVGKQALAPEEPSGRTLTPGTNTQTANPQPAGLNKGRYSIKDPSSIWVIANKVSALPSTYEPADLVATKLGQQLRNEAAQALDALYVAAQKDSVSMKMISAYRSYATQQVVYRNNVTVDGQEVADKSSARPGHSEHQTGLSVDLGTTSCDLLICFGETKAGQWLAKNAHTYGFIIRYPEGKESITGYQYEPWHLRYVGVDLATELQKSKMTMEEFFDVVPKQQPY